MISTLLFTLIAALLVLLAGRRDSARDPRLTIALLLTCGAFPFLATLLPKWTLLPEPSPASGLDASPAFPWITCILIIWAAGVLWHLARIGHAMVKLHQWKNGATHQENIEGIPILLSKAIDSPVAAGIWRPIVLVPATWPEWSEHCKQAVITHELEHHRRHDPQWRLLAALACAIHWYHPLVRWMTQRYILQSEFATDHAVIESGIPADRYANSLCDVATSAKTPSLAVAMADGNSLECRVNRMMNSKVGHHRPLSLLIFAVIGISCAAALATVSRKPDHSIPREEIELRLSADPFPGEP